MPLKIEPLADSQLNMTPMIDIVFQLILFFLFNLRFKSVDYRIESALPKDRGLEATPNMVQPIPSIKISLFRLDADDETRARTKIKVGTSFERELPVYKWTGNRVSDAETEDKRDAEFAQVTAAIRQLLAANPEFKGEIDTPPPKGAAVPHADVMRVLDAFIQAGVKEINFGGAAAPLPRAQRTQ